MKWMLDRIRQWIAAYLQKPAPTREAITPPELHQTDLIPSSEALRPQTDIAAKSDARRMGLAVENALKEIPGVTPRMLVAFADRGIKSVEDLAGCATDDLHGWRETIDGKTIRHAGILSRLKVSRKTCETIIINARTKAGWLK